MFMLPTVDEIYEWLGTLGVSLWADWYIESPDRRRLAAEWLQKQIVDSMAYVADKRTIKSFCERVGSGTYTRVDL